jgi:ribosome-associated protein
MTLAKLVKTIVAALEEIKARDVEVLDVRKITTLFDRMIIASGESNRQTRAIANNVAEKVKAAGGAVYGMEGEQTGEWILVDLGDVLVHVMQTAVRAHYNLEELWAEAKNIKKTSAVAKTVETGAKTPAQRPVEPSVEPPAEPPAEPPVVRRRRAPARTASTVRKNKIARSGPDEA